jgi:hypothetical protein
MPTIAENVNMLWHTLPKPFFTLHAAPPQRHRDRSATDGHPSTPPPDTRLKIESPRKYDKATTSSILVISKLHTTPFHKLL